MVSPIIRRIVPTGHNVWLALVRKNWDPCASAKRGRDKDEANKLHDEAWEAFNDDLCRLSVEDCPNDCTCNSTHHCAAEIDMASGHGEIEVMHGIATQIKIEDEPVWAFWPPSAWGTCPYVPGGTVRAVQITLPTDPEE